MSSIVEMTYRNGSDTADNEDNIIDEDISAESGDSETFLYDSVIEQKNVVATPRSLMLAGPRTLYHNSHQGQNSMKKSHRRSLSFAETIEPLTLSWNNVNVYAEIRDTGFCGRSYKTGETRQVLSNVSGMAHPGRLLAILGPSGSGKTCLLNVLTERNLEDLLVDADVRTNGQALGTGIKTVSAYAQATEVFIGNLKVKEHLWFHALIKMDSHFGMDDIEARIEELMMELGLRKCADTYIGVPGTVKGISGGEMKRLGIASELLVNPPIMFLDEPTSGLDSFMAENIIHTLKKMTRKNKTILCSIHQPSSETYALFDDVLLLGDGNVVYMGSSKGAANFFKACGLPCPINFNPADHFVHAIATDDDPNAKSNTIMELTTKYRKTEEHRKLQRAIAECGQNVIDHSLLDQTSERSNFRYKVSWARQLRALLWRHWLSLARDTDLFVVRVGQVLFLSVMIGILFYQQPLNSPQAQNNVNGANFLVVTMMSFNILFTVLNAFPAELPVFFREHSAAMYRVDAYFISRNITDILLFLLLPTILVVSFFGFVSVDHSLERFFVLLAVSIAVCKCAVSMGYFVSTVTMDIDLALAITPPIMFLFMMTSGYLVNLDTIIAPFSYLQYISWFRYGYEIVTISTWLDITNVTCISSSTTGNSNLTTFPSTAQSLCFSNGVDMIKHLQFQPSRQQYIVDFVALIIIVIVLRFLSFGCMYLRSRDTKKVPTDEAITYEYSE